LSSVARQKAKHVGVEKRPADALHAKLAPGRRHNLLHKAEQARQVHNAASHDDLPAAGDGSFATPC